MREYIIGDQLQVWRHSKGGNYFNHVVNVGEIVTMREFSNLGTNNLFVNYNGKDYSYVRPQDVRPVHWFIKQWKDNRGVWERVVEYLNEIDKDNSIKWNGVAYNYYGFDGSAECNGTVGYNYPNKFLNNAIELTLEEWDSFNYDGLSLSGSVSAETSSTINQTNMIKVTLTRKQLLELHKQLVTCSDCRSVIEKYLNRLGVLAYDDAKSDIEQGDLDRISELNPTQKAIVAKYIKLPEEKKYRIGERFRLIDDPEVYILAGVAAHAAALISLKDGKRYSDAVDVDSLIQITKGEMTKICDNDVFIQVHELIK